jgi:signal transduction histidine kinase
MAVQLHARECSADRESLDVALRQLTLTEENLKQFLAAPQASPESAAAPRKANCQLAEIVGEIERLLGPSLRHRRIAFSVPSHGRFAADQGTELFADADQLRQLLINLVLNAADAAGPGGRVKIEFENTARQMILRVIDSGPGPPAEIVDRLFEPFSTSKPEGVGLGLAAARQIAVSHGGQVEWSRRDDETCFEVRLPTSQNLQETVSIGN